MDYFRRFPQLQYNERIATNILARVHMLEKVKNNIYVYYPYVLQDFERPDILANKYYGHYKYTWIIFFANDIYDPQIEWPKDWNTFVRYLDHKYPDPENNKRGLEIAAQTVHEYVNERGLIVDWTSWAYDVAETMNNHAASLPSPYSYAIGDVVDLVTEVGTQKVQVRTIDATVVPWKVVSFELLLDGTTSGVLSVPLGNKFVRTKLRYEEELNEARRHIKLIDVSYVPQIEQELRDLLEE